MSLLLKVILPLNPLKGTFLLLLIFNTFPLGIKVKKALNINNYDFSEWIQWKIIGEVWKWLKWLACWRCHVVFISKRRLTKEAHWLLRKTQWGRNNYKRKARYCSLDIFFWPNRCTAYNKAAIAAQIIDMITMDQSIFLGVY